MDPTTKEGRAALAGLLATAARALAGLCDGTRPMRMSVPAQEDDPDLQIGLGIAAGKRALAHIDKLEAERDDLWKRIERHETSYSDMLHRAADETSRLRADLERAREALREAGRALKEIANDEDIDAVGLQEKIVEALCDVMAALSPAPSPAETPPTVGTTVMSPTDFEKFKRAIDPSPEPYEPSRRPKGSNADEWQLFLTEHANASAFLAVQIAEAIDDASKGARA